MKAEAAVFAAMTLALTVAACVGGGTQTPVAADKPPPGRVVGYLSPETTPDATSIIPPAPKEGDPRNAADWDIFRQTRALEGSERWALAQNDNSYAAADILKDYSCAVGVLMTPETVPALSRVLSRAATDSANAASRAKNVYQRTRPFLHNPGDICIERSDALAKSYDYPSGHASLSWMQGLVLAELAPDRSGAILARARAYGESRVVCGVHNWSAVEGGRTNAAGVFAALQGATEFRADMERAKKELDKARATSARPDAASCAAEARLTRSLFSEPEAE
ncbi:MAG: phosphatase PAP2 family protein [Alphaproteobacteria bacterium]|nr:phosphatase PAP2 family protein [Alphaproteobacteria bacterium]